MQHEGRAAGEGQRFLTVLFDEFDAQVLAVFFSFLQKTVGNVVMMDVDGAGSHSGSCPSIFVAKARRGGFQTRPYQRQLKFWTYCFRQTNSICTVAAGAPCREKRRCNVLLRQPWYR